MSMLVIVALVVLFSVWEGKMKKRSGQSRGEDREGDFEIPPIDGAPTSKRRQSPTSSERQGFEIPPIQGVPKAKSKTAVHKPVKERETVKSSAPTNTYMAYLANKEKQANTKSEAIPVQESPKQWTNSPDMHTNVLINAVAYAQILQPPKAYQYLATRSCRGDWQQFK